MTHCPAVRTAASVLALIIVTALPLAAATQQRLEPREVLARSEAAIGRKVGDYFLTDSKGALLDLAALRGKPLIISLVYTACSSVCPPATQNLIDAVREADRIIGAERFTVLTIGFDARNDTPARLTQFASMQGIQSANWRLASADSATIAGLLRDLGFSYVAVAGGFDHITQTTILDKEGRVYRQIYGEEFPLQVFMEPLKEAVYGTVKGLTFKGLTFPGIVDRLRYICTTFDPGTRSYRFDYGIVAGGILGAFSLLLMGGVILREWRRAG